MLALTHQFLNYNALFLPTALLGYRKTRLWIYTLVALPGIILHELSHAITALFLLVDVRGFHIGPEEIGNYIRLGYVELGPADALRHSIIGLSPLITGTGVIFVISELTFDITRSYDAFVTSDWIRAIRALGTSLSGKWGWVTIYLIFAVSTHMFPSPADRRKWLPSALFLLIIFGTGAIAGVTGTLTVWLVKPINALFRWLILILGLTLTIDLPILLLFAASVRAVTKQPRGI